MNLDRQIFDRQIFDRQIFQTASGKLLTVNSFAAVDGHKRGRIRSL
jgi:hypothetical protein